MALTLAELDARLTVLLPALYRDRYEQVRPVSMGSAGLKFGPDGKVAWDQIWGSFCDLAMAGGPPHRGTLLQAATPEQIAADPARYHDVTIELCRGLALVTGLYAEPASPGSLRLFCPGAAMAAWLARAIVMENVSASAHGLQLLLPAGPHFRLEKEIKNVITSVAKTTHYWTEHTTPEQQTAIAALLATLQRESPLVTPAAATEAQRHAIAGHLAAATGLAATTDAAPGWVGLHCPTPAAAVWLMRALITLNVLARRESSTLFVPINPAADPHAEAVTRAVTTAHALAIDRGVL